MAATAETEFERAVREMRDAQRRHKKSRHDPKLMVAANDWEKKVDDMLAAKAKPEQPAQTTLFG